MWNVRIASEDSNKKRRLSIVVVALFLLVSCVLISMNPESEATTTEYAYDNVNVSFNQEKYNEDYPNGITGKDIDLLKSYFTVTVDRRVVTENGDAGSIEENVTLGTGQFYLMANGPLTTETDSISVAVPTRAGDLYQDINIITKKVSVVLGSVEEIEVESISVNSANLVIYDSTTEQEIRNMIEVTATYSDDTSEIVSDYNLYVSSDGTTVSILIQYGSSANIGNQQTITKQLTNNDLNDLKHIIIADGHVDSKDSSNILKEKIQVVVSRSDGKLHYLEPSDYSVTDDLYTGSEKIINDSEKYPYYPYVQKEITITPTENEGLKDSFPLLVCPSTPIDVNGYFGPEGAYFEAFVGLASDIDVYVNFGDFLPKQVNSGYYFIYEKDGKKIYSNVVDEIKNNLSADTYDLTIVYEENGVPVPRSLGQITVEQASLPYPTMVPATSTYSATLQSWPVDNYTNSVIEAVIECSEHGTISDDESVCGATLNVILNEDGTYDADFQAIHQGEYRISFAISEEVV